MTAAAFVPQDRISSADVLCRRTCREAQLHQGNHDRQSAPPRPQETAHDPIGTCRSLRLLHPSYLADGEQPTDCIGAHRGNSGAAERTQLLNEVAEQTKVRQISEAATDGAAYSLPRPQEA